MLSKKLVLFAIAALTASSAFSQSRSEKSAVGATDIKSRLPAITSKMFLNIHKKTTRDMVEKVFAEFKRVAKLPKLSRAFIKEMSLSELNAKCRGNRILTIDDGYVGISNDGEWGALPGAGSGGTYRHFFEYDGQKVTHLYAVQNLGWAETSQIYDGCSVLAIAVHHSLNECLNLKSDESPMVALYLDVRQPKFKKLNGEELKGCGSIGLFP